MVRLRTYCINCPKTIFVSGDLNGTCKKRHWIISMKLASIDKVCSYDSFKDTFFGDDKPRKPEKLESWKKDW